LSTALAFSIVRAGAAAAQAATLSMAGGVGVLFTDPDHEAG